MNFVAPGFLYALFFLAIPIVIHLFNFRRYKTLYFPQVKFLKTVKKESQSASQLKHLLVLLSRLFALAAIVIAFAQPYGANEDLSVKSGKKKIQFYLDNSFSMQATNENGVLLESAKQKIYQIIKAYSESDEFQLLTNDFENNYQAWISKSAFIENLQNVDYSPQVKKLSQIINRFTEDIEENQNYDTYILSDLQKNVLNIESIDTALNIILIPLLANESDNISLNQLNFDKPYQLANSQELMNFQLVNYGSKEENKTVVSQLFINNELKTPFSIELGNKDSIDSQLSYTVSATDIKSAKLLIKDYPIHFDDTLYFNFTVDEKIKVSHLYNNEIEKSITAIYSNDSLFDYNSISSNSIDFNTMEASSCILVEAQKSFSSGTRQFFTKHLNDGGTIALLLNGSVDLKGYNQFLSDLNLEQLLDYQEGEIAVKDLNYKAELFNNVFEEIPNNLKLAKSKGHFLISNRNSVRKEDLLTYQNNIPALRKYEINKGKLYLFNIPFNDSLSSFSKNALFVPIVYNLALYSKFKSPLYYQLGEVISIESNNLEESPYRIVGKGVDLIPRQKREGSNIKLFIESQIKNAGHYSIFQKENEIGRIALNYDRKESNFNYWTLSEIKNIAKERGIALRTIESEGDALMGDVQYLMKGEPYWKYFVILALIFLALEILLIRIL